MFCLLGHFDLGTLYCNANRNQFYRLVFDVVHISVPLLFELFLYKSFGRVVDLLYFCRFIFNINLFAVKKSSTSKGALMNLHQTTGR